MEDIQNFGTYKKEMNDCLNNMTNLFDGIHNLNYMNKHVKKFGITKEFLDICDEGEQLSKGLNIRLEEDIDIAVWEEGFKEGVAKIIEKVKAFFKMLWEKFMQFLSFFKKKQKDTSANLKSATDNIKNKDISTEALKAKKITFIKYDKVKEFIEVCQKSAEHINKLHEIENGKEEPVNNFLKYLGKKIEFDSNNDLKLIEDLAFSEDFMTQEESNLYDLGYTVDHLIELSKKYDIKVKFNDLETELKNKEKDILNKISSSNIEFKPTTQLVELIDSKDLLGIHSILTLIINRDRSFSTNEFMDTMEYVKKQNIPDFIKSFDGRKFEEREKWTEEYWELILSSLITNFSEERINHLKEISKYLYRKDTYQYQLSFVRLKMNIVVTLLTKYQKVYNKIETIMKQL